jgi:phosphatidylinositol-bisphosphatase
MHHHLHPIIAPVSRAMSPASVASVDRLEANIPGAFPEANASQTSISTTHQTLSQALHDRRHEFTRQRQVRIKVGTWNTAAEKGCDKDIGAWFVDGKGLEESMSGLGVDELSSKESERRESVERQEARHSTHSASIPQNDVGGVPGGEEIGLYVLGLQEIVDITSASEALRPYTDPAPAAKWKHAVEAALPKGYRLVAEQQLIGLLLLIYASPATYPHVKSVSTTSVGTGVMGYMGNKGAVTARLVLGETTRLVFINSHLAAGADKAALERRNWDAGQIVSRTRFDPISDPMGLSQGHGEGIGEEDFAFWFGDLNYRLEGIPGDDVRRLLAIHTRGLDESEDPQGRPSTSSDSTHVTTSSRSFEEDSVPLPPELDPASLQTTILSLLPHDELHQQMQVGNAFHDGWQEGPIRFLPTYKYDVGKVGLYDTSEKRRSPSWCDRIVYRTRAAKLRYEAKVIEQKETRRKDEEMKAKGMEQDDEDLLYDYDPDTDGDNNADCDEYDENADPVQEPVITKEGFSDEILLEYYTSHMRVLSSDHKPLDAVFLLTYDAVVPELKAAIHQEVARELDRQENEGRPSIAVVVDRSTGTSNPENMHTTDSAFDGVDFGDVQFAKSKRRGITIANTGRVPATFSFADRPVDKVQPPGPFPPWLTVSFDGNAGKPNEQSTDGRQLTLAPADVCSAELKLKIEDMDLVQRLNDGTAAIDEVLVLRVEHGRDHFLPLRANWQQSTLARTIDKLVRIPEGGIRRLQHQKPDRDTKVKWSVPREIFRLTEALEDLIERTLADWDMTHEGEKSPWQHNAGWPFVKDARYFADGAHEETLANVYNALDCDEPFEKTFGPEDTPMQKLEILAEVLQQFLQSLRDGIVPEPVWMELERGLAAREKTKRPLAADDEKLWVLELLSSVPNHNASFLLLVSTLQRIAREITNTSKPDPKTPRSSTDLPASPLVHVRRKTLSKVPEVAVRQLINRNYASVFAEAVFKAPSADPLKDKDKALRKERMVRLLELFLAEEDRTVK